ncbi:MAG: sensor histidine kinase [Curtobacterium sp.]
MPSLRWRIVAAVALLLVATNVVVGAVTVVAFRGYLVDRLDAELSTAANRVVGGPDGSKPAPPDGDGSGSDPDNDFIGVPGQSAGTVVAIFRDGATVLGGYTDDRGQQHRLTTAQERTLAAVDSDGDPVTVDLGELGTYRAQAIGDDGDVFVTALPLGDLDAAIARLLLVIGVVTIVGLLVAAWALALLVRRSLRPLERVAAVASHVTELDLERGDTDIPVRVPAGDLAANREVEQVGTALNRLLGHVARALTVRREAETGMRTFVADASHELRTPIATVRAYAELSASSDDPDALHRNVDRIGREAVRMGDLVEELLLLARLDAVALASGPAPAREPVDLTSVVVEATMDARATAPGHRWTLQVLDDHPLVVSGDATQLRRVVTNLLANARTHTPEGTSVVVSLQRTGDVVRLVVANDGPVIPAEALSTLFDRFTRGEASRSREHGTSGLGLAIVRGVVAAHDGLVRVVSEPGRTAFTVELPAGTSRAG